MSGPPALPRINMTELLDLIRAEAGSGDITDFMGDLTAYTERFYRNMQRGRAVQEGFPDPPFQDTDAPGSPDNPLSEAEAMALFKELDALDTIPFDYPVDGSDARAHATCRFLQERGVACGKAWNFAVESPLIVRSDEFDPGDGYVSLDHHVAAIVSVRGSDGNVQTMVLDPMLGRRPLTIDQWRFEQGGETEGTRLELTDATPYSYVLADKLNDGFRFGDMTTDPDYRFTDVSLEYFTANRDLLRAFLGPYTPDE